MGKILLKLNVCLWVTIVFPQIAFGDSLNVRFITDYQIASGGFCENVRIREPYAYVCQRNGLEIVDISDPSSPFNVGWYYREPSEVNDVVVSGDYAYFSLLYWGFAVIDISDPSNPHQVALYSLYTDPIDLVLSGSYVYLAANRGGLLIFDVSDPHNPDTVGQYVIPGGYHFAKGVAVSGNYAYIGYEMDGFRTVDVSDPTHPYEVGYYGSAWVYDISLLDSLVYLSCKGGGLHIVNISNPYSPYQVGCWNQGNSDRSVISGSYAYVVDPTFGLWVIDISDPANPQTVGYHSTPGSARGIAVSGEYIYVADFYDFRIYQFLNPPQVSVLFPNGGELFSPGDTINITWVATDDVSVDSISILFSANAGTSWDTVATGEPNDSLYEWIIPNTPSDSCLVKVLAYDSSFNIGEDQSDSLFSIGSSGIEENICTPNSSPFFQCTPNPFKEMTEIRWQISDVQMQDVRNKTQDISLKIYDVSGRMVKDFSRFTLDARRPTLLSWDGTDDSGNVVRSGVYFCRFVAGDYHSTKKLLRLK